MKFQTHTSPTFNTARAAQDQLDQVFSWIIFLSVMIGFALTADSAFASPSNHSVCKVAVSNTVGAALATGALFVGTAYNPFCDAFMTINQTLSGLDGKAIATLAIMIAGIMALFGKISWGNALIISGGVGIFFGAAGLITPQGAVNTSVNDENPLTAVLNVIQLSINGEGGRAVGILCLIILGLGAMYGKISWVAAVTWIVGIGAIFGSVALVDLLWVAPSITSPNSAYGALAVQTAADPAIGIVAPFFSLVTFFIGAGGVGTALGSVAVIALGIGAMLGKVSWVRALMLVAGIALFYGSVDIVYILEGPLKPCGIPLLPSTSDDFTQVICSFADELQGPVGKTVASLGVMALGAMAMMGKVSWEMGITVAIGIALIFGAYAMINTFEAGSLILTFKKGGNWIDTTTCMTPSPTVSSTGNAIGDILCYIINILYGPAGKALAMIAVVMMGFGALVGKISFSQAMIVAIGIAVAFGAPAIVTMALPHANISGCTLANPASSLSGIGLGLAGAGGVC